MFYGVGACFMVFEGACFTVFEGACFTVFEGVCFTVFDTRSFYRNYNTYCAAIFLTGVGGSFYRGKSRLGRCSD